ncbi:MAG: type II secretion system protein [Bacillota bacterium]
MKLFDRLKDEQGVTLYELLAVLVISGVVLSSIYGVFITGVNLYKKIGIESQLKEEADIIVATVLNEFYAYSPDDVEYNANSNELILAKFRQVEISDKDFVTSTFDKDEMNRKAIIRINDSLSSVGKDVFLDTKEIPEDSEPDLIEKTLKINNEKYLLLPVQDSTGSDLPIIDFTCTSHSKSQCNGGIVSFHFQIAHENYSDKANRLYVEPIEFYSQFGF